MNDILAIRAYEELRDYCKEHHTSCDGCIFLDENEDCMFGTIAPCEWVLPSGRRLDI